MATVEEIAAIQQEVSEYFTSAYDLRFVRNIGQGSHGGTALYEEPAKDRKVVVKFSLAPGEDSHLLNELVWVPRFNRLEHFIQMMYLDRSAMDSDSQVPGLPRRPVMVLEYLSNGNLFEFAEKFRIAGRQIPNRLLWRFFLCMTRMCIGMAYYDSLVANATITPNPRPIRETIQEGEIARRAVQLSMKGENVIVGDMIPGDIPEHDISPLAKLIDFGRAAHFPQQGPRALNWNQGIEQNLFGAGIIMQDLACNMTAPSFRSNRGGTTTQIPMIIYNQPTLVNTLADPNLIGNQSLDSSLMGVICTLMSINAGHVPLLEELEKTIETHIAARTAMSYSYLCPELGGRENPFETDEAIRTMIQRIILSAHTDPEDIIASTGGLLVV